MEESNLQQIATLIKAGQLDQARELLRSELKDHPTADAWVLAAYAAPSSEQRIAFLKKALELNPFHERAFRALDKLENQRGEQPGREVPKSLENALLDQAIPVFSRHGWTMALASETTRKFDKKGSFSLLAAILVILFFNIFGILLVILSVLTAKIYHITLFATGQGHLLGVIDGHSKQYEIRNLAQLENVAMYRTGGKIPVWAMLLILGLPIVTLLIAILVIALV